MKRLLVIGLLAASAFAWAAGSVTGEVLEVQQVDSYTYLRMRTANGETWGAVATAPGIKKGAVVTIEDITVMNDFQSKALKRTFKTVVFGTLAAGPGSAAGKSAPVSPHTGVPKAAEALDVKVPKAVGANARTVGEIMAKPGDLKDKPVLVRGKVVKFSGGIMGRNWIHLRDGTGAAADKTNDLLVTTTEQAKVGDVVTAKGVVRVDKDFGAGYVYKALVEDAALQR
ncbi:MAG: hypothetical protein Q8Q73_16850 [Stagnimonas sp.]|nr:hypothetical protein [Stagnimonas sp.]